MFLLRHKSSDMKNCNILINLCSIILINLCSNFAFTQTTILSEDFSSMSTGFVTQTTSTSSNYQVVNNCTNETWEIVTTHNEQCSSCSGNFAGIYYEGSSCTQDNVFVTKQFSPTETQLNISFDYAFDYYPSGTNYFEVYLYNDTDGAQVGSDLVYETADVNASYSGTVNLTGDNSTSDNYTLRFHYYGNDDWGATFDNILVTETSGGGGGGGTTDVTIGNGTSESGRVPCYGLYEYSWSGMIYLQSEIGISGDIETISFFVDAGSPSSYSMDNQKIYLGHTTETQFPSSSVQEDFSSNYVDSDWTLVYDGTIDWSPGWEEITLTTSFSYNNSDNLLIKVENRDGGYSFSYPEFDYTSSTRRASYDYQDGSYPTGTGTRTNNRPNIKFGISTGGALPITLISFTGEMVESISPYAVLEWEVASQVNNHYFTVYHSTDGYVWEEFETIDGAGNTNSHMTYSATHDELQEGWNYYKLRQTDYDGKYEEFSPISLNVKGERKEIIRRVNLLGQDVEEDYKGIHIVIWDNGDIIKTIKR
jgi:hypothetical protein